MKTINLDTLTKQSLMIKYLQLAQQFHKQKLQAETALMEEQLWKQHYNKGHYEGSWSILPLRSINGSVDNIISIHSSATENINRYKNTALLDNCPYIKSVLNFFECEKTSVRLMKLHAGAVIKEHRDHEMSFEEGEARFHIPVITNPGVDFFLDNEKVLMQEGECWYLNLSLKHRVNNFGTADRVHLVIDCKVNDWLKEQFANIALLQKHISDSEEINYSKEDKQRIIQQLRIMNTPTSIDLATKMENE